MKVFIFSVHFNSLSNFSKKIANIRRTNPSIRDSISKLNWLERIVAMNKLTKTKKNDSKIINLILFISFVNLINLKSFHQTF